MTPHQLKTKKILFCEACGYKAITDEKEMELISRSEIQNGIKNKENLKQTSMIKCPKCGRGIILRRMIDAYLKNDTKVKAENDNGAI